MASTSTSTAGSSPTSDSERCHPGGVEALNLKVGPLRRNLFGPVDHQQLDKDLKRLLSVALEEANKRWNFDFQKDKPGEGSNIEWEALRCQDVPAFYHSYLMRPGASGPGKKTSSGQAPTMSTSVSGSDNLKPAPRGSYSLRQSGKHRQSAITDFFMVKKRRPPEHKTSSWQ
ncbi:cyclin-dependent kinase inhibitor 1D [Cynoglossus semilaevis]|uniref:Cyclin-dependent kinase inhibitor 1-like n=1 Tax=Cynoglossus semilaevis TaxID=244447 RepID=A0A3P8W086_CYNSE|nr:cyclin-dependent kinase inhibitor 1-like [Cynoglossus semilaevis]